MGSVASAGRARDVKAFVFFMERLRYRTVVVSDIHLGTRFSKVTQVSDFLASVDCERLIFNGDTIDGWQLQKNNYEYWGPEQARFFRIIMKMIKKREKLTKFRLKKTKMMFLKKTMKL